MRCYIDIWASSCWLWIWSISGAHNKWALSQLTHGRELKGTCCIGTDRFAFYPGKVGVPFLELAYQAIISYLEASDWVTIREMLFWSKVCLASPLEYSSTNMEHQQQKRALGTGQIICKNTWAFLLLLCFSHCFLLSTASEPARSDVKWHLDCGWQDQVSFRWYYKNIYSDNYGRFGMSHNKN